MQLLPAVAIHMAFALTAVVIGPFALWARLGRMVRPRWHRAFGYAWVTCMVGAALSSLFIRSYSMPNIAGYTPIHLLVPLVFYSLWRAFRALAEDDPDGHQKTMQLTYGLACIVTGLFTLLPQRYLGRLIWG